VSENLELVRSIYADWERGDFSRTDWADPQIEFVIADGPDRQGFRGTGAMSSAWGRFLAAWTEYAVLADEFRDLDDERVLVLLRARGRGRASGVEIASNPTATERGANLFHLEHGLVRGLDVYFDHTNALADLGLEE
jgi:hypothetical protein